MNSSENQQGDPNWALVNWDHPAAISSLDQATREYPANRSEWDWDPMTLAQHHGSGGPNDCSDGDSKNHLTHADTYSNLDPLSGADEVSGKPWHLVTPIHDEGTISNLRSYNMLSGGLQPNFTQTSMGIYNSVGVRNYGALDTSGNLPITSTIHNVLGTSGIPGLAATGGSGLHGDIRSSFHDQRREFFASMQQDLHMVKREDISDGHGARLGLNLGVRTYFSMEDTVAGRPGKRHRAASPGSQVPICQAEGCKADLSTAKPYHRRHKVCDLHSKAPSVVIAGQTQRFCQQCSRFHFLVEFDEGKRSCRKRLADHNRRRRKPQPSAVNCDMTDACLGMRGADELSVSHANDPKSMLLHLKKCGSPSSTSLEDSDDRPGSAGNNLQLHTSAAPVGRAAGEDHFSSQTGMQMSSKPMRVSEAHAKLLPAMSHSPPAPLMLHTGKHRLPMVSGIVNYSQDATGYQQYLQGVKTGQSGPSLSLSSMGGQGHQTGTNGQQIPGQCYNGMDVHGSWLRTIPSRGSDLEQVLGRPGGLNLQRLFSTDSKTHQSPQSATSATANSNSQDPDAHVFSANDQNLLPLQTSSGDIANSEWMLGISTGEQNPSDNRSHFTPESSLNNLSQSGELEGQQMLELLETSTLRAGEGENPGGSGNEFLHNTGTESGGYHGTRTLGSVGKPDLKYPQLHAPRAYGSSPIYDSRHNLL